MNFLQAVEAHRAAVAAANAPRFDVLNLRQRLWSEAVTDWYHRDLGDARRKYDECMAMDRGKLRVVLPDVVHVPHPFTVEGPISVERRPLAFDADDGAIRNEARRAAGLCGVAIEESADEFEALGRVHGVCNARGISPPATHPEKPETIAPALARSADAKWWRRRLRQLVARRVERAQVEWGNVQRHRYPYASDDGVDRRRKSVRRNRDLLASLVAVNEAGDEFTLADLADKSISNPELRRSELMVRIKGIEQVASERDHRSDFITWTLESRYHRTLANGRPNPRWDSSTDPRQAQAVFVHRWARARALLAKEGITLYGLRVAEPHHDACPHWHLLVFGTVAHLNRARLVLAALALEVGADEPGAQEHRFKAKRIDAEIGSAVGYVAKYLAKNVDGKALEMASDVDPVTGREFFTGEAISMAERITTWANTWGLRQFQFFGTPTVGPYRELRRLSAPVESIAIEPARIAADAGDFGGYIKASAGIGLHKTPRGVDADGVIATTRYGEEAPPRVIGVDYLKGLLHVITRVHSWLISLRSVLAPRTRVNNCNRAAALPGNETSLPDFPALPGATSCAPELIST